MCACSYVFMNLGIYSMRAFFHVFMPRTYVDALLILYTHTQTHTHAHSRTLARTCTHTHTYTQHTDCGVCVILLSMRCVKLVYMCDVTQR